jgi:hypothetical protein
MSSPSGVCNASVRVEDLGEVWLLLRDELLELDDLADLLEGEDLILLVSIYGETGGVVSTVFETGESWSVVNFVLFQLQQGYPATWWNLRARLVQNGSR